MGRSQRRKVLSQGIASDGTLHAEGVGFINEEVAYEGNALEPLNAGPREGEIDPDAQKLPLAYGSPGGPLQGSAVQSAYSEGGTEPTDPVPPEPPPEVLPPSITTITPSSMYVTDLDTAVTVAGANFTAASVVNFNAVDVATTFVDAATLTFTAPAAAAVPGNVPVLVMDASIASNTVQFTYMVSPP